MSFEERNRSNPEYPAHASIPRLFREQAERTPDAVAVVFGDHSLTYRTLDERATRLARHLAALGVQPEVRVGLCLERGMEMVVSMLAVTTAGGAYVPLDPGYPADRLAHMLGDASIRVLVTDERHRAALPARAGVATVSLDGDGGRIAANSGEAMEGGAGPRTLAYVIYTSGSTGTPKGVAVEHRGVVRLVRGTDYVRLGADDRVGHASNVSFDAATFEVWGALLNGATVVGIPADVVLSPARLAQAIADDSITTLFLTTALFNQVARETPHAFGPLRTLLFGGEAVDPAAVRCVLNAGPPGRLLHVYGPTECTTFSTWHRVDAVAEGARTVPIGRSIAHSTEYVLDGGAPAAEGASGELFLGGNGVARGYLDHPAATAERFVPDSLAATPGARLYRTGDRVRRGVDGALEFLGRVDQQVKVRGFRIEPGEIEAALRRCEGVADCAVVAREDEPGERRLVAYVAGCAGPEAMRAQLRRSLPEYMLPSTFVRLEAFPLTPNGKLDRSALPAPEPTSVDERFVAPRTPVEVALARIWGEVLRMDAVSVDRPFVELGGHSLRAIAVLSRIAEAFGVEVPVHRLLRSGSVAEIARLVEAGGEAGDAASPPVERAPRDRPVPLSFSQEAVWFFEQFAPSLMAYRAQAIIRMRGPLDVAVLERALGEIVRRHEIFRTTTREEGGVPVQVIHAPWSVHLAVHDVSGVEEARREAAARDAARAEFAQPIDLAVLPLVGWSLVRLSPEDHLFVVVEHHFVHDGWSFALFLRELRALYPVYVSGGDSTLPEPPLQFADFAAWQRGWMAGEAGRAKLRFWEQALAGVPPLALPTDFPRPSVMRFRGDAERVHLPPALADRARAFSREHGVTFFVTLLAAFQVLLGRLSGQRDFCVGSAVGNRAHPAFAGVIGMLVNTVSLRADLAGDPAVAELVGRVRDTALLAYAHQDVPFDQVVRHLQPERSTDALPINQVSFSFHDSAMPELSFGDVRLELEEAQNNGSAKFDLQVIVIPRAEQGVAGREDEVVMVWEYNTDLFERGTVRRMAGHFERLLDAMVHDPDRRLSRLEVLGEDERRCVVEEWNRTEEGSEPAALPVHALIEAQAARTPDEVAVVFEDVPLTFAELDARANRLAQRLVGLGVGPEARVGICLERSAGMVVAMLAVLKAGAAYLPLDPSYPAGRLAYMLDDSGAAVLVTENLLRSLLPAGIPTVSVDADAAAIAAEAAEAPRTAVAPGNAAYVIYTSGSTGRPKGVVVTHANVAAFFAGMDRRVGGTVPGTWLAVTRIGFDIHVLELLWTLARGFRVVVHPDLERAREDGAVAERLRRHGVTHLQCTPTLAAMLLAESGVQALSGLDRLLLGGEALPAELAALITDALPGRLLNLYGPTETTVWSTTHTVVGGDGAVPIGRPIAGTRTYLLDGELRPQPVGVPGELYVGGAGITRGYLGRPGLTAERFVPDPFGGPGARLYRTGDRARWRDGGVLEFLGRLDAQVKIRGFRVEPGEVESTLRRHPGVRDCAVVARRHGSGEMRLAAYVAASPDVETAGVRAFLRGQLPEYMVPATITRLDALPLLPNGKLDRQGLPAPDTGAAPDGHAAPAPGAESGIALIWREILGREGVGRHDDFFALGGDSLQATRVVVRTRSLLGREVPVTALFDHRTLAAFSQAALAFPPSAFDPDDDLLSVLEPAETGAGSRLAFPQTLDASDT